MEIISKCISSLEKVMLSAKIADFNEYPTATALINEKFNFQIAYTLTEKGRYRLSVETETKLKVTVRNVGYVPALMPCYPDHDDYVISDKPGLFPDILENVSKNGFAVTGDRVSVLWVNVDTSDTKAGKYPIIIKLKDGENVLNETVFTLEIKKAVLPKQTLVCTNWFYTDCLANHYNVPVFSEDYWRIVGNYMKTAVEHGVNMILTPIFTPPLDTAVGTERRTVQLIDVKKNGNKYSFGFKKLKRWAELAKSVGVEYLEISHLYTQWGANNAPKIMATENGEYKRIFGWKTDAYGEEYTNFLSQLFPALIRFLKKNGLMGHVYFHVSDEPYGDHLAKYKQASDLLRKYTHDEFPIIDALSSYEFYEAGAIKNPIPGTNHIKPFLEHNVPNLWCYYCCGQHIDVSNRFISFPSARNRILGVQLYKFNIVGFLQWGFNFWNSQISLEQIDPFNVSDARESYPAGDGYVVYPGFGGEPICSLRFEVFYDAIQDMRALQALEKKIGREKVLELIDEGLETPIAFDAFPHNDEYILSLREKINKLLA